MLRVNPSVGWHGTFFRRKIQVAGGSGLRLLCQTFCELKYGRLFVFILDARFLSKIEKLGKKILNFSIICVHKVFSQLINGSLLSNGL